MPWLLPVAALLYLAVMLVLPAARLRRMTGSFGLVLLDRKADRSQRVVSACLAASMAALFLWTVAYAAVGARTLSVWPAPPWVAWAGWACLLLGAGCTAAAQAQMGASWRAGIDPLPTALVTNGLYAVARNPIFAGVTLTVAGVVAITPSPWSILISAPVFLLINLQVRAEERHLIALHGARYLLYASRVGRFLPRAGVLPRRG